MAPILTGFFLTPLIIRNIGATAYGIWMLAASVVGYMGLINLGLGPTVTKKAAEYLARDDIDGLNRVMSTMFVLYIGLGVLLGFIILISEPLLPLLFDIDADFSSQFNTVVRLIGLQAALGFPFAIFAGLLHGRQDFHLSTALSVGGSVMRVAGTVILLSQGGDLVGLLVLEFAINLCTWVIQAILVKCRIPSFRLHWSYFYLKGVAPLFRFSGVMFIWRTAALSIHRAHRILIGLFFPLSTITLWEIGSKLAEYPRMGFMSFLTPLMPVSSELKTRGDYKSLRGIYLQGTRLVFASYAGAAAILHFWGAEFIKLWVGTEFLSVIPVLNVLLIGNLYQTQNVVAHVMLPGMDKLRTFTFVMAAYPILSITSSLVLIRALGFVGLAYGVAGSMVVLESILLRDILRIFGLSLREFLRECHLKVAVCLLPALVLAESSREFVDVDGWGSLIVVCLLFISLYSVMLFSWFLTQSESANLRAIVGRSWILGNKRRVVASPIESKSCVKAESTDTNSEDTFHECAKT